MLYSDFIIELKQKGRSDRTCREYKHRVKKWVDFLSSECNESDAMKATEDQFMLYRQVLICSDMSVNTINSYLNGISLFYKICVEKGYIDKSPCPCSKFFLVSDNSIEIKELSIHELNEIKKLIHNLDKNRMGAMLCMLATGARPGVIANLTYGDIVKAGHNIFIRTYRHDWKKIRLMPVMDIKIAPQIFSRALGSNVDKNKKVFNISKRDLIKTANKFKRVRDDFHYHLFRYTHFKRLERNNVPAHIINYLYGEGPFPDEFKDLEESLHHEVILKHKDALFQA
ncbi:site-specific integrase [Lactobacillaceae bacterium Melli_B4]